MAVERTCPQCWSGVGDDAKFCEECGARLSTPADATGDVRKTITVLFCDLVGSTSLGERTDPELLRVILERYFSVMKDALERHGGTVEKFIGDAVVALFGVPTAREDDALRAVRAAFDMHDALARVNPELEALCGATLAVRIGVNTGEVFIGASSDHAVGDAVNVAARLEQSASAGDVLVGETTWQLVRDAADGTPVAPLDLKGKDHPVAAWRLTHVAAVEDSGDARSSGVRTPLVGRERELALLRQAFDRAAADRACQLCTLFGAAGVGKSRLATELVASLGAGVRVVGGRCLPYGDGTSLWPLAEAIRSSLQQFGGPQAGVPGATGPGVGGPGVGWPRAAGPGPEAAELGLRAILDGTPDASQVVDYLAPVLGGGGSAASAEELHWAVRRWVEALAAAAPVVWVMEDLHWAEPAFVSLVEDVADWTRDAPILLLCLARPELLDEHPTWGGGKLNAVNALLKPLSEDESARLVASLARSDELGAGVVEELLRASGGTPLFLEQFFAMMADGETGAGDGGGAGERSGAARDAGAGGRAVAVPATIGALLTARLEQLGADERRVLEGAAVTGQVFYAGALGEVTALNPGVVAKALRTLVRKDLVRATSSDVRGEEAYAFSHVLVADTAYQALPKLTRAAYHDRFAKWLEKRADDLAGEPDEFSGHHLATAATLLREVGDPDGRAAELGKEAAARLRSVATRFAFTDPASASALYAQAAKLVPGTAEALDLAWHHGVLCLRDADYAAAWKTLGAVREEAEARGERSLALRARVSEIDAGTHVGASLPLSDIDAAVREALDHFAAIGDDEGLAAAYSTRIVRCVLAARWGDAEEAARSTMSHARACADPSLVHLGRRWLCAALVYGPQPVAMCLDAVRKEAAEGDVGRIDRGLFRTAESSLLAYLGLAEPARAACDEALAIFDETRSRYGKMAAHFLAALAERSLGDAARCEAHLLALDAWLESIGEQSHRSTGAGLLARLRCEQGDWDEARRLVALATALSPREDAATEALVAVVSGMLAAAEGDFESACRSADEAVAIMERTDQTAFIADMHATRGEIYASAGRAEEARRSFEIALAGYRAKGDLPDARRIEARLAR